MNNRLAQLQSRGRRILTLAVTLFLAHPILGAPLYFNGFEVDTFSWSATASRVPSGSNGITSFAGSFHAVAVAPAAPFTQWGGYNYGAGNAVPTVFQQYSTVIRIYLDIGGGWVNNTRFDFSSAINNSSGTHKRDFIFNAGFYNDTDGSPGSGFNRFIVSASTNSQPGSAFAKNPARLPIAILASGWYTFRHRFYDNGGTLAVDMTIHDSANAIVGSWTLSDPTDLIGGVGGNRYGWFDYNQFSVLAFDDAELELAVVDEEPPVAVDTMITPGAVAVSDSLSPLVVTSLIDDTLTGGSNIVSAELSVNGGAWTALAAADAAFDEASEAVTGSFTLASAGISSAGVYTIRVRGTDAAGLLSNEDSALLAVYDPNAGFVTGGGWINSPALAYAPDLGLTGKASFGFVSKYKKGANVPEGSTEFVFNAGGLNFHSSVYEWLVVNQNGTNAQFKGTGRINGAGNYGFMIWANDNGNGGSTDTFRIQIVDKDDGDATVYDNGVQQLLGGGNIMIQTKK